jgi:hypothetical protein
LPEIAATMPTDRSPDDPESVHGRVSIAARVLDGRTREAQRRRELVKTFCRELGADIPPTLMMRVEAAAELQTIAEAARAGWLAASGVSLEDVVRTERAATSAVQALRIGDRKPKAETLHDYLAAKAT